MSDARGRRSFFVTVMSQAAGIFALAGGGFAGLLAACTKPQPQPTKYGGPPSIGPDPAADTIDGIDAIDAASTSSDATGEAPPPLTTAEPPPVPATTAPLPPPPPSPTPTMMAKYGGPPKPSAKKYGGPP